MVAHLPTDGMRSAASYAMATADGVGARHMPYGVEGTCQ